METAWADVAATLVKPVVVDPGAQPDTLLVLSSSLTGAVASFAAVFSPWANQLGRTG